MVAERASRENRNHDASSLPSSRVHVGICRNARGCAGVLLCRLARCGIALRRPVAGTSAMWSVARVMLFAVSFSVVMAFMYAFVGLYRPNPIGLAASLRRTGFCGHRPELHHLSPAAPGGGSFPCRAGDRRSDRPGRRSRGGSRRHLSDASGHGHSEGAHHRNRRRGPRCGR